MIQSVKSGYGTRTPPGVPASTQNILEPPLTRLHQGAFCALGQTSFHPSRCLPETLGNQAFAHVPVAEV